jgi:hypothetical protein
VTPFKRGFRNGSLFFVGSFFLYLLFLLKEKVTKSSRKKQTLRSFFRASATAAPRQFLLSVRSQLSLFF